MIGLLKQDKFIFERIIIVIQVESPSYIPHIFQSSKNSSAYSGLTIGIFGSYPSFSTEKVLDLPKIAFRHIPHEWIQVTTVSLAMDQMLGTALLLLIILAVTDEENMKITSSLVPVIIGLGLSAIHLRLVPGLGLTHISKTCPIYGSNPINIQNIPFPALA